MTLDERIASELKRYLPDVDETGVWARIEARAAAAHRRRIALVAVGSAAALAMLVAVPWLLGRDAGVVVATTTPAPPTVTEAVYPDGTFVPTGTLNGDCMWCQAVVLADGRVLVVGGDDGQLVEIYDPATGAFEMADRTPRQPSDVALLTDGRVVITGLPTAVGESPYLQIFDPGTGESAVDAIPFEVGAAAVRLADGRVLIVGTEPAGPGPGAAVIFEPSTETFAETGPMAAERQTDVRLVLLGDGRVLVVGGAADAGTAEIFDPTTDTFTLTGSMSTARYGFTATGLEDGRVLIVGGGGDTEPALDSAEIFDPATGTFTPTGSMAVARFWHAVALLPDGRVLVVGGSSGGPSPDPAATSAEFYDPATGRFDPAPAPTRSRVAATAVTLPDGQVLILGNYAGNLGSAGEGASSAEMFTLEPLDPAADCCAENPTEHFVEAVIDTAGGRPTLAFPTGALEGAIGLSVVYSNETATGGDGWGEQLGVPSGCGQGCRLPLADPTTQPYTHVQVEIAYEGSAPPEASLTRIEVPAGP